MKLTCLPHQAEAVSKLLRMYEEGQVPVACVEGGTGSGKTLVACELAMQIEAREVARAAAEGTPVAHAVTVCIVPSMCGNVIEQWRRHILMHMEGSGGSLTYLFGPGHPRRVEAASDGPTFVLTTVHTLFAMYRQRVVPTRGKRPREPVGNGDEPARKRGSFEDRALRKLVVQPRLARELLSNIFESLPHVSLVVVDEFHDFRNGSNSARANEDFDATMSLYCIMNELFVQLRARFTVGLSATPMMSSMCDLYSFLRLANPVLPKSAWVATSEMSASERKRVLASVAQTAVVRIGKPPFECPPLTLVRTWYRLEAAEVAHLRESNARLCDAIRTYLKCLHRGEGRARARPGWQQVVRGLFVKLSSAFTVAKRGALHPAFYNARPCEDTLVDMRTLALEIVQAHPLSQCSLMRTLVERIAAIRAARAPQRILVMMNFAVPCEVLRLYIAMHVPGVQRVLAHHSKCNDMREFVANEDAIMIATSGSIGTGVSIEVTNDPLPGETSRRAVHVIRAECASSHAAQKQLEGRHRRPMGQGWPSNPDRVREWVVEDMLPERVPGEVTMDAIMRKTMQIKEARCAVFESLEESRERGIERGVEVNEGILRAALCMLESSDRYES